MPYILYILFGKKQKEKFSFWITLYFFCHLRYLASRKWCRDLNIVDWCHPPDVKTVVFTISWNIARAKRREREREKRARKGSSYFLYLFLTHSPRRAYSSSLPSVPKFFSLPAFFPSRCSPVRARILSGTSSAILPATKVEFLAIGGALVRKATAPPPPLTYRGRNLSLADDPLKRICPRTRQCTCRHPWSHSTTRDQSDAIDMTWHVVCDTTWCDTLRCRASRDATLLSFCQSRAERNGRMYRKKQSY